MLLLLAASSVALLRDDATAHFALQPNSSSSDGASASLGASPSEMCPEHRFRQMLTRVDTYLPGALAQVGASPSLHIHCATPQR